jgi:hypothetical protein
VRIYNGGMTPEITGLFCQANCQVLRKEAGRYEKEKKKH